MAALKEDFQAGGDDYLELCAGKGVEPEKPYKGSFNVQVSPEIHRAAAICAAQQGTSLNCFVAMALQWEIRAASGQ